MLHYLSIAFTSEGTPISDFDVPDFVSSQLPPSEGDYFKIITTCNISVWEEFRMRLSSDYQYLQAHTKWWVEDDLIHIDYNRSYQSRDLLLLSRITRSIGRKCALESLGLSAEDLDFVYASFMR